MESRIDARGNHWAAGGMFNRRPPSTTLLVVGQFEIEKVNIGRGEGKMKDFCDLNEQVLSVYEGRGDNQYLRASGLSRSFSIFFVVS